MTNVWFNASSREVGVRRDWIDHRWAPYNKKKKKRKNAGGVLVKEAVLVLTHTEMKYSPAHHQQPCEARIAYLRSCKHVRTTTHTALIWHSHVLYLLFDWTFKN